MATAPDYDAMLAETADEEVMRLHEAMICARERAIVELLQSLPHDQRRAKFKTLVMNEATRERIRVMWEAVWARPNQLAPEGDWRTWMALAGRGFGKTEAGAQWIRQRVRDGARRIAIIAETQKDLEEVMVARLMSICPAGEVPSVRYKPVRVLWPNGAMALGYNGTEPDQLRGPEFDTAWVDELAKYAYARETWDMLQFTMRSGDDPRVLVTTTPRPIPIIKEIKASRSSAVTTGKTMDNAANLSPQFIDEIVTKYAGTRLGRQELNAEILDDMPGALWNREMIDATRVDEAPEMARIVIAVDPSGTRGEADEQANDVGIVVVGLGMDGQGYVLADLTCNLSPDGWARRAVDAYYAYEADRVIAETNFGGAMVESVIRSADPTVPFAEVKASRGKVQRAEPIAAMYEQGRVSHVGALTKLEDQMMMMTGAGYAGEGSPDRVDACLIAGTMVHTERGDLPIEQVNVGDHVLTREGWKPVEWAGVTRSSALVRTLTLSNGNCITGTDEHPVWIVGRGWVLLAEVQAGSELMLKDDVAKCVRLSKSHSTEISTAAIPKAMSARVGSIITASLETATAFFTETFGNMPTSQSLPVGMSTTETSTRSTTISKICSASAQRTMPRLMRALNVLSAIAATWTKRGSPPPRGTALPKASLGIDSMEGIHGKAVSDGLLEAAQTAAGMSSPSSSLKGGDTAPGNVIAPRWMLRTATRWMASVQCALRRSRFGSGGSALSHAPVTVVRNIANSEPQAVYNLHVRDCHEFIAGGVLVHNCVWGLTDLMINTTQVFATAIPEFRAPPIELPSAWPRAYAMKVEPERTCVLWSAYDRLADVLWITTEHVRSRVDPAVNVAAIASRGKWIPGIVDSDETKLEARRELAAFYAGQDLNVILADRSFDAGIQDANQRISTARLKAFATCQGFFTAYRAYRRDEAGEVIGGGLMDCLRLLCRPATISIMRVKPKMDAWGRVVVPGMPREGHGGDRKMGY